MLAVAGLLVQISAESRTGKADARLAAGLDTAINLEGEESAKAQTTTTRLARDPRLAAALRSGNPDQLGSVARELRRQSGATAVEIIGPAGRLAAAGAVDAAVAFGAAELRDGERELGTLRVSSTPAAAFTQRVEALTKRNAVVIVDGRPVGATVQLDGDDAPPPGETSDVEVDGSDLRARTTEIGDGAQLVLLGPQEGGGLLSINLRVAILLATLLAIALTLTFYLARTMHQLHELVSAEAVTDELTGLSNQRRFRELLHKETERAKRFGHDLSLLMLDLDDFKGVNDTHGHLQGDDVLRAVANAIRVESRGVDEPARYGGEEFSVALPETDAGGAYELAERIRNRVKDVRVPLRRGGGAIGVTISIGVGELGGPVEDSDGLVDAADSALYAAKREGKDRTQKAQSGGDRAPEPAGG